MLKIYKKNKKPIKFKKKKRRAEHIEYPDIIVVSTYIIEGYSKTKEFEIEIEMANLGFSKDDYKKLKEVCKELLKEKKNLTKEELAKGITILRIRTKQ